MPSSPMTEGDSAATAASFSESLLRLRSAQKTAKGAPPYSLWVNRPVGRLLAAAAYQFGLTPNHVTVVSGAFSLAGILVLAAGEITWSTGFATSVLLAFGYALDSADGQLARLRGGGSVSGEWLDHMIDSFKISSLHLAVLVAAVRHNVFPGGRWWLAVPILFAVTAAVHFFGMILVELLHRERRAAMGVSAPPKTVSGGLRSVVKAPTDYGVLCWVFVLLGVPTVFGAIYALLAAAMAGYLLLILRKWHREVAELDASGETG